MLVHFLLAVNEAVNHLLGIAAHCRQVESKLHFWSVWGTTDVHEAVHLYVVAGERPSELQVREAYGVEGIHSLEVERRIVRVSAECYGSSREELELLMQGVLNS